MKVKGFRVFFLGHPLRKARVLSFITCKNEMVTLRVKC